MKEKKVFKIQCPRCRTALWIDNVSQEVIKWEKGSLPNDKKSLESLLSQEKKRIEGFDKKFEATFELQKTKKKQMEDQFRKAVSEIDSENDN